MPKSLLLIFVFLFFGAAFGNTVKPVKKTVAPLHLKIDTGKVSVHQFNADTLNTYRKNPEFNYATKKAAITWWDRFWDWVWLQWEKFKNWLGDIFDRLFNHIGLGNHAGSVFKYFIIGMFAFMVVYIIFRLLGMDLLSLFRKKKDSGAIPYTEFIENIHEINFDEAIENALAVKNYRLAVRLLYLRCLKQLSDNNLIHWKIEKTNSAYLNELTDEDQRRQFALVTRQFEYVWYGDFPINGQSYQNIQSLFQEFKRKLS